MITYADIVTLVCTFLFFCFYTLGIIVHTLLSRKQNKRFTLASVAIALVMGFAASTVSLLFLYWIFG